MAISTKLFTLTTSAYQDVSEGNEHCAFRLAFHSFKDNAVRISAGTVLPAVDTVHFDRFSAPEDRSQERHIYFNEMDPPDRIYVRLESAPVKDPVTLTVYRK